MATKHTDLCLQKVADDEPIFVLRAQDRLAASVVRHWAEEFKKTIELPGGNVDNNQRYNAQIAKYQEALALADRMDAWGTKKMPD